MLHISDSTITNQTVMLLRPSSSVEPHCAYLDILRNHGLSLVECISPDAAYRAMANGCRVGLLILDKHAELSQLERYEPLVNNNQIAWVGLVAQELIATPRMRDFIGEHMFNFITTPADPDHIILTLRHAWGMTLIRDGHASLPYRTRASDEPSMVGNSPQMQRLSSQIQKVARTDASVLITGPSGTGKEIAALSIHRQSARAAAPFVAVNCGAIAPQLFQSELFGYEKGAFTGAAQRRIGRIEAAQGGTLFLDEIGDMPFDMQVNLLRFLQEKTIERVGGTESIGIDVRIIAATHIDLAEAVRQGSFREDLYYRINVICLETPPLADRGQDIEDIAKHYFARFAQIHNRSLRGFSKAAMNAMLSHTWPGNVRELVNRVQRATVMAEGRFIQPSDLGFENQMEQSQSTSLEDARAVAESTAIRRALSQSRNQISRAAALLGVSRVTLYRLMEKYDIRTEPAAGTRSPPMVGRSASTHPGSRAGDRVR